MILKWKLDETKKKIGQMKIIATISLPDIDGSNPAAKDFETNETSSILKRKKRNIFFGSQGKLKIVTVVKVSCV